MKKFDYMISALLLAFSAWIFYATKDFPEYYAGAPGSGFWPRIIAVILILLSVALIAEELIKSRKKTSADEPEEDPAKPLHRKRVYLMFAAMIILAFSLKYLGFVISALWFIPAVMLIMEEKRWPVLLASSVGITAAVYVIFTYALKMSLPKAFFM